MNSGVKDALKYALILFAITAIVGAMLSGVNMLTKDTIAQNDVVAEQNALREVMNNVEKFVPANADACAEYEVEAIYEAKDANGAATGHCFKIIDSGYGGKITAVVGVSEGKVTGVSVISHSETPGLGANIKNESFRSQYIGKGEVSVVKAGAADNQINAVSGATISSKAMTRIVNKAVTTEAQIMMKSVAIFDENGGGQNAK